MQKKYCLLILLLFGISVNLCAQDLHFSQYFRTPIFLNPALTGILDDDMRIMGVFRNQWAQIPVPYNSFGLSVDGKIPLKVSDNKFGIGTQILTDRAGDSKYTTTQASLASAFHLVGKGKSYFTLSLGANFTYYHRKYDPYQLTFDNQFNGDYFDPTIPINEQFDRLTLNFVDAGIGLNFNYNFLNGTVLAVGGSVQHIASTEQNYQIISTNSLLQPKWNVYLNGNIKLGENIGLVPLGFFQFQDKKHETVGGMGIQFNAIPQDKYRYLYLMFGFSYRFGDAFIPWAQLDYQRFSFQFSYDGNTSPLKAASNSYGGVELTLGYRIQFQKGDKNQKLECPYVWF